MFIEPGGGPRVGTMRDMHPSPRAIVLAVAFASLLGACGDVAPSATAPGSPSTPGTATPGLTPVPTPAATDAPTAPVTDPPEPTPGGGTTETEWGTIVDVVPETFPVIPGASPLEILDEPASGAWMTAAGVDEAASWYAETMTGAGYAVDLGSTLEDGSRVLDARTDLPECRIQAVFRPAGESTIITVLYGAGCAGPAG
jgi:hypothetical protein